VRITGRIKDLIIRGGENISPKEIEDCLRDHPAVADAYVYGVPDDFFGEVVAAAVRVRSADPQPGDAAAPSAEALSPLVQRSARALQGAQIRPFRDGVPDDRLRQGAEVQTARRA
jgi:acyl-CoA synthetase (AMP-forming)/AMP-acid ligase II